MNGLMNQGWPAADSTELDGWLVRRNAGVTLRANSVLPANAPFDLGKALDYVENLYRRTASRRPSRSARRPSPPTWTSTSRPVATRSATPTLVQCAEVADVLAKLPEPAVEVNISSAPSDSWMDCWWRVDGHGGAAEQATARQILDRGRALYATVRSGDQITAIGRLALVDDWSGLYCLAVDERFRRQGLAQAVIHGLLQAATARGSARLAGRGRGQRAGPRPLRPPRLPDRLAVPLPGQSVIFSR